MTKLIIQRTFPFEKREHLYRACVNFRNAVLELWDMVDAGKESLPVEIDIAIRKEVRDEES